MTRYPSESELIVVTKSEAEIRAMRPALESRADADVAPLNRILERNKAIMRPLFGATEDRLKLESAPARGRSETNLSVYYTVDAPKTRFEEIAEELRESDVVEGAYVKPPAEPPLINEMSAAPAEAPTVTPDFERRQGYLDPAPSGVDARRAWRRPGGRGAGVRIIDIEGAWRFSHEDLRQNQGGVGGGSPSPDVGWRDHGTAVIGVIGGDRNDYGIVGICPDANVSAVSIFGGMGSARAIRDAALRLRAGDIILLELHRPGPRHNFRSRQDQKGYIAIEWWPDDFDAIVFAIRRGIVVVEAAGNGAENLDDPIYENPASGFPSDWTNPFDRRNRDSGAIVVGAGAPPPGTHGRRHGPDRSRLDFSNYGSAVDTQGWGREVTTCGYGDLQGGNDEDFWYTDQFSGTSSASPIVVGVLGCLQGLLRAKGLRPLTPKVARERLRSTGSPQQGAPGRPSTQQIGNRPDLRQLMKATAVRVSRAPTAKKKPKTSPKKKSKTKRTAAQRASTPRRSKASPRKRKTVTKRKV